MQQKLKTSEEAATPDDYFNKVVLLHSRETKGTGQQKRRRGSLVTSQTIVHMLMILIKHVYFVVFMMTMNKNGLGDFLL